MSTQGGTGGTGSLDDPAFYEALGRAIKVLRAERGVERRELAEASGISYPYLSEIENGKKRASSKALIAIAEALGVAPSDLLAMAEDRTSTWAGREEPLLAYREPEAPADAMQAPPPPAAASPAPGGTYWRRVSPGEARMVSTPSPRAGSPKPSPSRRRGRARSGAPTSPTAEELADLLTGMSPEDVERVLDLARRLSGR